MTSLGSWDSPFKLLRALSPHRVIIVWAIGQLGKCTIIVLMSRNCSSVFLLCNELLEQLTLKINFKIKI